MLGENERGLSPVSEPQAHPHYHTGSKKSAYPEIDIASSSSFQMVFYRDFELYNRSNRHFDIYREVQYFSLDSEIGCFPCYILFLPCNSLPIS